MDIHQRFAGTYDRAAFLSTWLRFVASCREREEGK